MTTTSCDHLPPRGVSFCPTCGSWLGGEPPADGGGAETWSLPAGVPAEAPAPAPPPDAAEAPAEPEQAAAREPVPEGEEEPGLCERNTALVLAILPLCLSGVAGVHRFYVGKVWTGLLQLFTLGGFLVWAIIDVVQLAQGTFRDGRGLKLRRA